MKNKTSWKILTISIVLAIVVGGIGITVNVANTLSDKADSSIFLHSTAIYVPDDYSTIQEAVEAANMGDTIIIRRGTYIESVKVNKSLTIRSEEGSALTRVSALNPNEPVFLVTADYVNITGFTVRGTKDPGYGGIRLAYADYCIISNNTVSSNDNGVFLHYSNHSTIINNNLTYNRETSYPYGKGIYVQFSNSNKIMNNTISGNTIGIELRYSKRNRICLNNFINERDNVRESFESVNYWESLSMITYIYNNTSYMNCMGNYWDDYTGNDTNDDGIGDVPYEDIDLYPLMERFENYSIITPAIIPPATAVSIKNPSEVSERGNFTATVNVDNANDLAILMFKLTFDPAVIDLINVEKGYDINTSGWSHWNSVRYSGIGTIKVFAFSDPSGSPINESAELAQLEFEVIGEAGDKSAIDIQGIIGNSAVEPIKATWLDSEVAVMPA
jgi:parallel beta-helix repeat protein